MKKITGYNKDKEFKEFTTMKPCRCKNCLYGHT